MNKTSSTASSSGTFPKKVQVYKAPWGWSFRIFDDGGKQIFTGTMYESEEQAKYAAQNYLKSQFP
ncbi:hypothetical protein [Janthinobacterium lividum]|uniref:hypothetical protein n=1 Tax=Janthinobacterium lividum TaxID=29581 RepID=UPI001114DB8C|nr:hypothetical protein [Janthinobacterium lividum]